MKNKLFLTILLTLLSYNIYAGGNDKILFKCFGTEPFWSAEVTDKSVKMKMMSDELYNFSVTGLIQASGVTEDYIKIFKLENENVKSAYIVIKKTESCKCSDGMSDELYEYEAYIVIDNSAYYGCAVKK